jgi:hypothetical protein
VSVRKLIEEYLDFAGTEQDAKGNVRAKSTMTNYRRALEGFATAVEYGGNDLKALPNDFMVKSWLPTQDSVAQQPIQLRVRASAVKQFTQWCFRNNIEVAPFEHLAVNIERKPKPAPVPVPVTQERVMTPELSLADAVDNVPATSTYVPPPPPAPVPAPPPMPQQRQTQQKAPVGSGRPANPLSGLLPTGQYKLRVRREREMDEPVWVGDFAAERVATYGAVEPFLGREVGPRLAAQGVTGDITFMVSAVSPDGREGERARLTVAVAPPQQAAPANFGGVQSIPAPVVGGGGDLVDLLAHHRKAQEEIEERIAQRLDRQQAQQQAQRPAPQPEPVQQRRPSRDDDDEMAELRSMVRSLAGTVNSLASRLEAREMDRFDGLPAQPAAPAAPQLDILSVIKEVAALNKPAPVQPAMGMSEMFGLFGQMKSVFQPQQVNIDVSPLEERMEELAKAVAQTQQKGGKSRTMEMVEEFKAMKELFQMVGGGTDAPKPTGLSSALGSLVEKLVNDPEPLAMAVERVLGATAGLKGASSGRPATSPTSQQSPSANVPESVRSAMRAMTRADSPESLVVAAHEWLTSMAEVPALQAVTTRVTTLIREEKTTELAIAMKQVFGKLGAALDANKAKQMAEAILAQVKASNESGDDAEVDEEVGAEVVEQTADYTVRVGGGSSHVEIPQDDAPAFAPAADDADEEVEEEEEDEEEEDEDDIDATEFSPDDVKATIGG